MEKVIHEERRLSFFERYLTAWVIGKDSMNGGLGRISFRDHFRRNDLPPVYARIDVVGFMKSLQFADDKSLVGGF